MYNFAIFCDTKGYSQNGYITCETREEEFLVTYIFRNIVLNPGKQYVLKLYKPLFLMKNN